ncbi:MAG: ankyrin repeat domain-containing protein [Candidatus Eremiobacteraeota bacterium]|nr:ankyrin repeat domain-containing protein [Candidatus Eremiobacteraeota bacterium]
MNNHKVVISFFIIFFLISICAQNAFARADSTSVEFINAIKLGNMGQVKQMLKKAPSLVNARGRYKKTIFNKTITFEAPALHFAIRQGDLKMAKYLVSKGANIEGKNNYGTTSLLASLTFKKKNIAKYLINKGANVNAPVLSGGSKGWTALRMAANNGYTDIVNLLIKKGAKVNAKDANGLMPLHGASYFGYTDIVQILISGGANVNAVDKDGNTALHAAAASGKVSVINLLLSKGAKTNVENAKGNTPLRIAVLMKHKNAAEVLRKASPGGIK